jgi:hypothetical protein
MGEAARRRRAAAPQGAAPAQPRGRPASGSPRDAAFAALARLLKTNTPERSSLAAFYAFGYGTLGVAQRDDDPDSPSWLLDLDPLDALFLGASFGEPFTDRYDFGNARNAWLRVMRASRFWPAIQRFVVEVVQASQDHQLPVDEGELMLLVVGRLEDAGLDQRKLPADLSPRRALARARCLRGPDPHQPLPAPPPDAANLVARLWAGTDVRLSHDGTPADALREGIHLLRRAGLDVHTDPVLLLVALYVALVGADSETLRDAPPRAQAWALGLPEDSPLVAVADVLLLGPARGWDVDTTLRHLFGVPAFTRPVPAQDRRFTSEPGHALVDLAFELGYPQLDTRQATVMRLGPDAGVLFQAQTRAFEEKFGRPPGPDDPIFFDPDADEPRPMPAAGMESATTTMLTAAGICGAWVYACQHTDGLLPRPDGSFNTEADAREWQGNVDRYLRAHPGDTVDDATELGKLRAMLAMISLDMAARTPEYGATLARQLQNPTPRSGSDDAELLEEFLHAASTIVAAAAADPARVAAAAELARGWSGASMAHRVQQAAHADPDDMGLDIRLALAAASVPRP